jgi:DNA end-binding protein Ku
MPGNKIWTGTLSFVLVSIPVELISIIRHERVSFRLMHKTDNHLLQRRMFCPKHKVFVHGEHIVNGYETQEGKYVVVQEAEYKALEPKRSQSIEINSFVDYHEIDPIYFDRPYYLLPRKGGAKSYQMLTEVLKETNKAGIAQFVLRNREHLAVIRARDELLELMTLHFSDEIRGNDELLPKQKAEPSKVKILTREITKIKGPYEPEKYIDDHRQQILKFLQEKADKGKTVVIEELEEEEAASETEEQTDLVAVLEESLSKAKSSKS